MKKKDAYEYKTFPTAMFHIPEGMYSIKDLEQLVKDCKKSQEKATKALVRSLLPLKGEQA